MTFMKKIFLIAASLLLVALVHAQSVGIGTNNPSVSAQLDVNSSTKGLLPPRMTAFQRDSIVNPVAGLMIWCRGCGITGEMQVYNGSVWTNMVGGAANKPEVTICSQRWMAKNLDVTIYRNGDPIPKVTDNTAWFSLTTGAYCYYNNDSATYAAVYGKLYNWYAVNDPRGLAPAGWHIPNDVEWATLVSCLGGTNDAGGPMKQTGTAYWLDPNAGATNSSGFTGLPGGLRGFDGTSLFASIYSHWWSTTTASSVDAKVIKLSYATTFIFEENYNKRTGLSVRCVGD
jgi:uncharacterized protein (TIGR02145 family)